MANKVTTIFDAVDRGLSDAVNRIRRSINEAEGATNKLKAGWSGVVAEFKNSREAQISAATGAAAVAAYSIKAASDLEESVNAVNVQYGRSSKAVLDLGEDSATAFGMSQRAFNEFAVGFSAFADQIAVNSGQQVADVVEDMATRIADFASVHNLSLQEAEQVAKSTLAGETESFRRYGGDVSAATVEAYAFREGIAEVGSELTEGQKVLARYGLFMEQTRKTAGDFANTSGSLANQQRIALAQAEDLAASLGRGLLPSATAAANAVNDLAQAVGWFDDQMRKLPGNRGGGFGQAIADGLDMVFTGRGADHWKRYAEGIDDATAATERLALATAGTGGAGAAAAEMRARQDEAFGSTEELRHAYGRLYQQHLETTEATEESTEAVDEQTEALREQREAADELINKKAALVGGDIAVRQAQREARGAAAELNTVLGTQGVTLDKIAESTDAAAAAHIDAAQAATDYKVEQAEANGVTVTASQKAQMFKEELERLASQVDGPLRQALDRYIGDLDRIPATKTTTITTRFGTNIRIDENGNVSAKGSAGNAPIPAGDDGGIVPGPPGSPQLALLHGGETVIPTHKMPGSGKVAWMLGGGGLTVNIYPSGPLLGDKVAVSRWVTEALIEAQRRGYDISVR